MAYCMLNDSIRIHKMLQHTQGVALKNTLIYTGSLFFFIIVLPLLCVRLFPVIVNNVTEDMPEILIPDTIDVYITEKDSINEIDFESYIEGVVASEMPDSFGLEALKAQAVASRTYALGRINAGSQICDTQHCQVYRSTNISKKVKKAVKATRGEILTYNDELAASSLYFASSAGDTENSEDVFASALPYLRSVSSDCEPNATHKKEVFTYTVSELISELSAYDSDSDFTGASKSNIRILAHTAGGRVDKLQIGDSTMSGSDFRAALGLYSSRIKLSWKDDTLQITTSGSGHGVGMSQYGASGLAGKGYTYKEILAHYYTGTHVRRGR